MKNKIQASNRKRTYVSVRPGAARYNARFPVGLLRHLALHPTPPPWPRAPLLISPVSTIRSPSSTPQPRSLSSMFGITVDTNSFPDSLVPVGVWTHAWSSPSIAPLSPPSVPRPLLIRNVSNSSNCCKARVCRCCGIFPRRSAVARDCSGGFSGGLSRGSSSSECLSRGLSHGS